MKTKIVEILSQLNSSIVYLNPDMIELPDLSDNFMVRIPSFRGEGAWAYFPFAISYIKTAFENDIPIFVGKFNSLNHCAIAKNDIGRLLEAISKHNKKPNETVDENKPDEKKDEDADEGEIEMYAVIGQLSKIFGANLPRFMSYIELKDDEEGKV